MAQPAPANAAPAWVTVMSGWRPKRLVRAQDVEAGGAGAMADDQALAGRQARAPRRRSRRRARRGARRPRPRRRPRARAGPGRDGRPRQAQRQAPGPDGHGRRSRSCSASISVQPPESGVPVAFMYPKRSASAHPGRRLPSTRAADEGGAPRGAQGRLPQAKGCTTLPPARRDPHHGRVRERQRRRGPHVRGRGARARTRTGRGCRSSGRPESCSTRCSGEIGLVRGGRVCGERLEVPELPGHGPARRRLLGADRPSRPPAVYGDRDVRRRRRDAWFRGASPDGTPLPWRIAPCTG